MRQAGAVPRAGEPALYAGIALKQTVVLTGTDSRIEVWSKEQWRSYNDEVEPDVAAIAATLADVGI